MPLSSPLFFRVSILSYVLIKVTLACLFLPFFDFMYLSYLLDEYNLSISIHPLENPLLNICSLFFSIIVQTFDDEICGLVLPIFFFSDFPLYLSLYDFFLAQTTVPLLFEPMV